MPDRCPSLEDLITQEQLPAGHAGRAHLDHCPRCRSLIKSHAAFLAGSPAHADGEREARLAAALEQEMGLTPVCSRPGNPVLRLLRSRATAPVLAAAAVLVLAVGLQRLDREPVDGPTGITRSAAPATGLDLQAEWSAGGTLELSWQGARAEGRHFRVLLLGADLTQLASFDAGREMKLALPGGQLPENQGQKAALWQVEVLQQGDVVERSEAALLPQKK